MTPALFTHQPPVSLPDPPPGTLRIGWAGFALALPETWNLSLHSPPRAMPRHGLLVFSDLRGPALEVRWQTPRRLKLLRADPRRALEHTIAKLRAKHKSAIEPLHPPITNYQLPITPPPNPAYILRKNGLALAADRTRLFELHSPRGPDHLEQITRDFLSALPLLANGPWLWSLYGIHAWLPPAAQLRQISLRPGDCRLHFSLPKKSGHPASTVTLANFSLAHQLLRGRSLRNWASQELDCVRQGHGTWQESENAATWHGTSKSLRRTTTHETHLHHNPAQNRIHWTHAAK